jgi:hypothetical protein
MDKNAFIQVDGLRKEIPEREGREPGLQYVGYQNFVLPVGVDIMN